MSKQMSCSPCCCIDSCNWLGAVMAPLESNVCSVPEGDAAKIGIPAEEVVEPKYHRKDAAPSAQ